VRALVIGAERLGRVLAEDLLQAGHEVTMLESDAARVGRLPTALADRTVHGSPLDRGTLGRALAGCDAVAAITRDDALNAVVAIAARRDFDAPASVAVIRGPARAEALAGLGVHVICPTTRTATEVHLALVRSRIESELHLGADAGVYRMELPGRLAGRPLHELTDPGVLVPVALERHGRVQVARPELVTAAGDVLHVAAAHHDVLVELVEP
jgi:trk system potassium uptake protein TrkA